jgi:hypothetical protein
MVFNYYNLLLLLGVAVACAIKAALEKHNLSGKILLLGTPGNPFSYYQSVEVSQLIFGQRRKVVLAKWLFSKRVLIKAWTFA